MPDKQTIRNELVTIIAQLLQNRKSMADLTKKRVLSDLRRMVKERNLVEQESKVALEVCNERNEDGKLVYSNEAARKAEITARLAKDDGFAEGVRSIDAKRRYVARARANESVLSATIKNLESMERLGFVDLESKE